MAIDLISTDILKEIIIILILFLLYAWIFQLVCKMFKIDLKFKKALIPSAILIVVNLILKGMVILTTGSVSKTIDIISDITLLVLILMLPKIVVKEKWGKSLLIGFVWFIILLIIAVIAFITVGIGVV